MIINKMKKTKVFNKNRKVVAKRINRNRKANQIYSLHRVKDNHR